MIENSMMMKIVGIAYKQIEMNPRRVKTEGLKRFYLKEVKKYGQFAELIYSKK